MPDPTTPAGMTPLYNTATFNSGTQSGTQQQSGVSSGQTAQANTYNPSGQALQDQGAASLSNVLSTGQLPGNFGMSQLAFDALNQNFNRYQAPALANQFGAGSAAIGASQGEQNMNLAAQMNRDAWTNYNNVFNDVANFAYTPTGSVSTNQQAQSQSGSDTSAFQTNNTQEGALLAGAVNAWTGLSGTF